jgi:CheY-like chemotaxis protein
MAQLLLCDALTPAQRQRVEAILHSGDILLGIIHDILDFSRLEAGHLQLKNSDFSLTALLDSVLELFVEPARADGLALICRVDEALPEYLRGDEQRLRQVLLNLLSNALKFTSRGEIRLSAGKNAATSPEWLLRVEDTGVGIPPEALPHLFEAFYQADNTTTRQYGGTGLGLAICRELVTRMDGRIEVESMPGQGSCFTVHLPLLPSSANPPEEALALRGVRLLVASADASDLSLLRRYAALWETRADFATRAEEVLACLRAAAFEGQPHELAIIDLESPDLDAPALLSAIAQEPALAWLRGVKLLPSLPAPALDHGAPLCREAFFFKPLCRQPLYKTLLQVKITPLVEEYAPAPALLSAAPRVLLVVDDPLNLNREREALEMLNCQIVSATNGAEAIQVFLDEAPDLVLMDCLLPELDGYRAAREIRRIEAARAPPRRTPVIGLTSYPSREGQQKRRDAGIDDLLERPLAPEALRSALERWLGTAGT